LRLVLEMRFAFWKFAFHFGDTVYEFGDSVSDLEMPFRFWRLRLVLEMRFAFWKFAFHFGDKFGTYGPPYTGHHKVGLFFITILF